MRRKGRGEMKNSSTKITERKKRRKLLSAVAALALALSMMAGILPGGQVRAQAQENTSGGAESLTEAEAQEQLQKLREGLGSIFGGAETYAALDETVTTDGSTINGWTGYLQNSTQNVGRIWTDKTVQSTGITLTGGTSQGITVDKDTDADFLVGLSALSSTSNLTTVSDKPLDIVLVLDRSGSMGDNFSYVYSEVYEDELSTSWWAPTYYALVNGSYVQIQRNGNQWRLNGEQVYPKRDANDEARRIQFYERSGQTKMAALRSAVGAFIDSTVTANEGITAEENKHRVSIVSFSTNANQAIGWTVCDSSNAQTLKNTVNGLNANGATRADYGMSEAEDALDSSRENAQKVVIFFTDGVPTSGNSFESRVANAAISSAKNMKDEGALIYSIGIFAGADAADTTTNTNAYMHGVSSNYPEASTYTNLGDRAEDSDYYKVAADADELSAIFEEIAGDIQDIAAGSPTQVQEGMEDRDGYITFTDRLGDYMEVPEGSAMTVVYANQSFTASYNEGQWSFSGTVEGNDIYGAADLSNLLVTVTKGQGSSGDTITVQVPASLIPLRNYKVDTENDSTAMEVKAAYPIRIFYNVALRESARESLGNPDETLQNYIGSNSQEGKVSFYSNYWSGTNQNRGDTTASFTPSTGNTFYYFTADTPLYTDEACTQQATWADRGDQLYYKHTYYEQDAAGAGVEKSEGVALSGQETVQTDWQSGNLYVAKGTPRYTRIGDFYTAKDGNATGTAADVVNPQWSGTNIQVALGNNGKLEVELPGALAVTKEVTAAEGFDEADYADEEFDFTIQVAGAAGEYQAALENAQGEMGESFALTFTGGQATCQLKAGETLYIYGLDGGAAYTVTEAEKSGYTQSAEGETGTIAAGEVAEAVFTNAYAAEPVTGRGAEIFKGAKVLEGRDWMDKDAFTFRLTSQEGTPMPESASVTLSGDQDGAKAGEQIDFNFGDVEYTKPGTYTYTITEAQPAQGLAGMSYSGASYEVTVTVTDQKDGTMEVTSSMRKLTDDQGGSIQGGTPVEDKTAVFTNDFDEASTEVSLSAGKSYTDTTGQKPIADGMFQIQLKPTGANGAEAPMPQGTTGTGANRVYTAGNAGTVFTVGDITFDNTMDGDTYTYEITEVNTGINGMVYSGAKYTVEITVSVNGDNEVQAAVAYKDQQGQGIAADQAVFANTYDPADAVLEGEQTVQGSKTLTGRDMKEGETYEFTLEAYDQAAKAGVANGSILLENNQAQVSGGRKNAAVDFSFGKMTFTKPGTFVFSVRETGHNGSPLPADGTEGMTYDRKNHTVTITVTDNGGTLSAAITGYSDGDKAQLVNDYEASLDYGAEGGIQVGKTLNGRMMNPNEFTFTISGNDEASREKLRAAGENGEFKNTLQRGDGVEEVMHILQKLTFTEADADQTYSFTLAERQDTIPGVTNDPNQYTVTIAVRDNGDGTLDAVTKVWQGETELASADTAAGDYAPVKVSFVNNYKAQSVSVGVNDGLRGTKTLWGRDSLENETFDFTLEPTGDTVQAVADGKVTMGDTAASVANLTEGEAETFGFGNITINQAGTYTFQVKEVLPEGVTADSPVKNGVTYDTGTAAYTIFVRDNTVTGRLEATVTAINENFENTYEATPVTYGDGSALLGGHKYIDDNSGSYQLADGQFTFIMRGQSSQAPMPEGLPVIEDEEGRPVVTVQNTQTQNNQGIYDFGTITFTEAGTYQYNIFEGDSMPAGITKDNSTYTVTFVVTEDLTTGTLSVTPSAVKIMPGAQDNVPVNMDQLDFTNIYNADEVSGYQNIFKTLSGRDFQAGDTFTFDVSMTATQEDGSPMEAADLPAVDGAAAGGQLSEVKTNAAGDGFDYSVTITPQSQTGNTYRFNTGKITYTHTGTYVYKVSERESAAANVASDQREYTVTVEISLEGNALKRTVTVTPQLSVEGTMDFVNVYEPGAVELEGEDLIDVQKTMTGREWLEGDSFQFELTAITANAPLPQDNLVTIENQGGTAAGTAVRETFGAITFTKADLGVDSSGKPLMQKDFVYQIAELGATIDGVTCDDHQARVTVTVKDNGDGTMSVEQVVYDNSRALTDEDRAVTDAAAFTNSYAAKPAELSGAQALGLEKKVTGHYTDNDFHFTLRLTGGDASGVLKGTGDNTAAFDQLTAEIAENFEDGDTKAAKLGELTFTKAGTYTFQVTEDEAAGSAPAGWTYDGEAKTITVTVTDKGYDGQLDVQAEGNNPLFTNAYSAVEVELKGEEALQVQKTLTGREDGQWTANDNFTFTLTGEENAPMPADAQGNTKTISLSADDAAEGVAIGNFGNITYGMGSRDKTYEYTITEEAGNVYGMTYSQAKYKVTVHVADNHDGTLAVTAQMTKVLADDGSAAAGAAEAAAFANTYRVQEDTKTVEKTGADGAKTDVNGQLVGVGDTLTYTVHWVNNAVDEHGVAAAATVTVTDKIPAGTALVQGSISDGGVNEGGTITWDLGQQEAGAQGEVSFQVTVTEEAASVDKVTNTATVQVGGNDPKTTNQVTVDVPKKEVTSESGTTQVGDKLTYTIDYANTKNQAADIVITDKLHEGLTYNGDASHGGTYNEESRTITWVLSGVEPQTSGTVTFTATVNEKALGEALDNQAVIQVGDDPAIKTTTATTETKTGDLTISKEIVLTEGQGTTIDETREFTFAVELKDKGGNPLTESYSYQGDTQGTIEHGTGEIILKHGQKITIQGLPEGASYRVTEINIPEGYTQTAPVAEETQEDTEGAKAAAAPAAGTITAGGQAEAAFANTYNAQASTDVPADFSFTKVLEGKKWDGDTFTFQIEGVSGTGADGQAIEVPMPAETVKEVSAADGQDADGNDTAKFDFGAITYTQAGTYIYKVTEIRGDNPGIDYSANEAAVTVIVTDKTAEGVSTGKFAAAATVENGTFTNIYSTGQVGYDGAGGIQIVKTMTGRRIEAEEFTFTMTAKDAASQEKLGAASKTFATKGAALEGNTATETVAAVTGLTFTKEDAGKTYTYTVGETNGGQTIDGVTYDGKSYTVEIKTADNSDGTLRVDTYVDGELRATYTATRTRAAAVPVTLEFANSYDAGSVSLGGDGEAKISAAKTLTNSQLSEGQFAFKVYNAKDSSRQPLATGTNSAAGNIAFGAIRYTTESLNSDVAQGLAVLDTTGEADVYTYSYIVAEDTAGLAEEGITAIVDSFSITVKITDNRAGKLSVEVIYPEGSSSLAFENAYGKGQQVDTVLKGGKVLDVESGDNAPDITGKFTFSITGSPGAPMPEKTQVTNDAAENVDFGRVTYTMENVFGDDGADGDQEETEDLENPDEESQEGAELPENAQDQISGGASAGEEAEGGAAAEEGADGGATAEGANGGASAEEGADGGAAAEEGADGGAAVEEEADGGDEVAGGAQGANDAEAGTPAAQGEESGGTTVQLMALKTGEANGVVLLDQEAEPRMEKRTKTFTYTITESGSVPGVTNDAAVKTITVTVTDNGDGTLSVVKTGDAGAADGMDFTFTNTYRVTPTDPVTPTGDGALTIRKELEGRALRDGEFSFQLKDANGNVVSSGKNAADGTVALSGISFDKPGSYEYTLSEAAGELGGVTYDQGAYQVTAMVADNGDGTLSVTWTAAGAQGQTEEIIFRNTYKPAGTSVTLGAAKVLKGRELKAGEFTFQLKDEEGRVLSQATNDENGAIAFEALSYQEAGTYTYTITEVKGQDETITYDETVYTVTVNVADSGDGYLTAAVDMGGQKIVFANTYTKPAEPEPEPTEPPQEVKPTEPSQPTDTGAANTGDYTLVLPAALLLAAALMGIILLLVIRRRRA